MFVYQRVPGATTATTAMFWIDTKKYPPDPLKILDLLINPHQYGRIKMRYSI